MNEIQWLALALGIAGSVCAVLGMCSRCGGSGIVNVKNGGVKLCPFCDHGQTRRAESRQLAQEAHDWFATVFWAIILAALLLGAVAGHAAVSVAYGQAEQMPPLYLESRLPFVSK